MGAGYYFSEPFCWAEQLHELRDQRLRL